MPTFWGIIHMIEHVLVSHDEQEPNSLVPTSLIHSPCLCKWSDHFTLQIYHWSLNIGDWLAHFDSQLRCCFNRWIKIPCFELINFLILRISGTFWICTAVYFPHWYSMAVLRIYSRIYSRSVVVLIYVYPEWLIHFNRIFYLVI